MHLNLRFDNTQRFSSHFNDDRAQMFHIIDQFKRREEKIKLIALAVELSILIIRHLNFKLQVLCDCNGWAWLVMVFSRPYQGGSLLPAP